MSKFTHGHRLRNRIARANKGLKAFLAFLILIADKNPVYCFLCGNYIHPNWKKNNWVFQPFGNRGDWVHRNCYNEGITYEIANQKLNEDSLLICHYQMFTNYHPEGLCRTKIKNNIDPLGIHLEGHEGFVGAETMSLPQIQHEYYLKPTGRKFGKPRVI